MTGLGEALDPLLDVAERLERGLDRCRGNVLQYLFGDGIAQAVEVVDELAAGGGRGDRAGAPEVRARPGGRAAAPARSAAIRALPPDRPATGLPVPATGTARSIARGSCRGPWRDDRCSCATAENSRQVAKRIDVSGPGS